MSNYQTLKSSVDSRVRLDQAQRLASNRQDLGESLMCPAGSSGISFDEYGRPATLNTLPVNTSASCGKATYDASTLMGFESNTRPNIPICASGMRGAGDFMGRGRDDMPMNLYSEGYRGNFVKHFNTPNNSSPEYVQRRINPSSLNTRVQPFSFSHDATSRALKL